MLVATDAQVHFVSLVEENGKLKITKSKEIESIGARARQIVQFSKNGRVFYTNEDAHVNELQFKQP